MQPDFPEKRLITDTGVVVHPYTRIVTNGLLETENAAAVARSGALAA